MKNIILSLSLIFILFACDSQESFTGSEELEFSSLPKAGLATVTNTYQTIIKQENLPAGTSKYTWNGKNSSEIQVSNGLYLITITVDDEIISSTAAIIKR